MLPDRFLRDRIPGANQLAHRFDLARGLDLLELRQRPEQPLQVGGVVGVVRKDAVGGEESVEELDLAAVMRMSTQTLGTSITGM